MKKNILDIIIVNYNTSNLVLQCIESINNADDINSSIYVVDSASSDDSVEVLNTRLKNVSNVHIISLRQNKGFAAANNEALKHARAEYVLLLNSDTLLKKKVLSGMIYEMEENRKIGISTCKLLNKDMSIQGTGGFFPTLIRTFTWMTIQDLPFVDMIVKPFHPLKGKSGIFSNKNFYNKRRRIDWVTGAFMMIRRQVIEDIGLLDEDYFMYTEDTDYCYRAKKAGWDIEYIPDYSIVHFGGASSSSEFPILREFEGIKTFYKKHYPLWQLPVLRFQLKVGSLLRMVVFALLNRKEEARVYAKAFAMA